MEYQDRAIAIKYSPDRISIISRSISFSKLITVTLLFTIVTNLNTLKSFAQTSVPVTNLTSDRPSIDKLLHKLRSRKTNSSFIISPHKISDREIHPFTTTIILNELPINHLTDWQTRSWLEFGNRFSDNFGFHGLVKINSEIQESLAKNNIFTIEQTGQYIQIHSIKKLREVTVDRKQPQTMTGIEMQMSLVAACLFPDSTSGDICSYTPGLITDRNSIDRDFLVPTQLLQTSEVGEIVKPETLAVIMQPGFQMGTKDQQLGLDFYFPNAGTYTSDRQAEKLSITRTEIIDYKPGLTFSRVRQIIKANDREAALGLTIRGWTGILDDKNTLLNSAVQFGTELLPDAIPQINGSTFQANKNVNINLFLAARNTRVPANSFTAYHAGIGKAASPASRHQKQNAPKAQFNSLWFGISPVVKRHYKNHIRYILSSDRRIVADAAAEGGVNQNIAFVSAVNNEIFSTPTLENFYTQIYLKIFEQDVNLANSTKLTEETSYYPHVSFSGNLTGSRNVFRYYTGIIFAKELKPYIGLDYTKKARHNWNYQALAIGYINPDREYYSHLASSISKTFTWNKNTNFVLSTGFDYILDGDDRIDDAITISPESSVTLGAVANVGAVSFGVTNFFGGIFPESVDNTLLTTLAVQFSKTLRFSIYFSPINENSSRSRYGANLQWRLGKHKNSPSLAVSWSKYEYDFGEISGRDFQTNDDVFTVQLQIGS